MSTTCKDIQYILDIMHKEGNKIKEVQRGWSETDEVIVMSKGVSETIKQSIAEVLPHLEYWSFDGSLLDPPDEGFLCKKCSIAISFPSQKMAKWKFK